jgi:hypothetical protein
MWRYVYVNVNVFVRLLQREEAPAQFRVTFSDMKFVATDAAAVSGETLMVKLVFGNSRSRRTERAAPVDGTVVRVGVFWWLAARCLRRTVCGAWCRRARA